MSKEQELKEMLKLYSKQDLWNRIQAKQAMIYDLEARLAESEKQRQHLKDWLDNEILTSVDSESYYATINEYEEEVKKLKQRLEEKEKYTYTGKEVGKIEQNYDNQLAIIEKALELAVKDKCKFENALLSTSLGIAGGKVAVPKKEQYYIEQAKELLGNE